MGETARREVVLNARHHLGFLVVLKKFQKSQILSNLRKNAKHQSRNSTGEELETYLYCAY